MSLSTQGLYLCICLLRQFSSANYGLFFFLLLLFFFFFSKSGTSAGPSALLSSVKVIQGHQRARRGPLDSGSIAARVT